MVQSSFFEYPGQGGPVMVSVFSNMDEKPDWTELPSTIFPPTISKGLTNIVFEGPVSRLDKRPRPDWTSTDQDQKFTRPIKTITAVWSSVHQHFGMKDQAKTGLSSLNQSLLASTM